LPMDEIARLEALEGAELNDAKKRLAFEATRLCHGESAAAEAAETARATFEEGAEGTALPSVQYTRARLEAGIPVFEVFVAAKLAASNSAARKLIRGGGGRLNDKVITVETQPVTLADVNENGVIKLSAGKKRHALVQPV